MAALEQRLAEAHSEQQRAEQRHGDVTLHLKAQLRDLQVGNQKMSGFKQLLINMSIAKSMIYIIYIYVKGNEMTQHVQHALLRQHAVTAKQWLKRMEKRDASRDSAWHSSVTSNKGTTRLR